MEWVLDESSLFFISGYAAFKIASSTKCSLCNDFIQCDDEVNDPYFNELNRGGLTVPRSYVVEISRHLLSILRILISAEFEKDFLKHGKQRELLMKLTAFAIETRDPTLLANFHDKCAVCGNDFFNFFNTILKTSSNIGLNNYTKIKNDDLSVSEPKTKKRKADVFVAPNLKK